MKKLYILLSINLLIFLFLSCNNDEKNNPNPTDTVSTRKFNEEEFFARIDQRKVLQINEIIQGFASPVEISAIIKTYKIEYSKDYLANPKIAEKYETSIKKAFGFGLLSADMGYLTIYNKTVQMVDYLLTINSLANDLRVSQFYDFQTVKQLVTSADNLDSLLFLTVSSFNEINTYFTTSNRTYLTVAMVTGVWVESMYLLTQVVKSYPTKTKKMVDIIGGQKDILNKLFDIVKIYQGHPNFDYFISNLEKLVTAFSPVNITIVEKPGKIVLKDDNYIIYPTEEAIVQMTDETLVNIIKTTEEVRNNLINIP